MPQPKIKSKTAGAKNKMVTPANDSYMIGLDPKTIAINARIMKEAAKGPKMKMMKDGSAILSPLKQVSALSGKKDKSTVAPKTVAAGIAKRSPILMKKKC